MALEFYSKTFLNKEFDVDDNVDTWYHGMKSADWKAICLLHKTLERFEIPFKECLRLQYEVLEQNEDDVITKIKICKVDTVQTPTNRH